MARRRRNPTRIKRYAFVLGDIERHGPHVTISREHGAYLIKRHPGHPAGGASESTRTLTKARRIASRFRRESTRRNPSGASAWVEVKVKQWMHDKPGLPRYGSTLRVQVSQGYVRKYGAYSGTMDRYIAKDIKRQYGAFPQAFSYTIPSTLQR